MKFAFCDFLSTQNQDNGRPDSPSLFSFPSHYTKGTEVRNNSVTHGIINVQPFPDGILWKAISNSVDFVTCFVKLVFNTPGRRTDHASRSRADLCSTQHFAEEQNQRTEN